MAPTWAGTVLYKVTRKTKLLFPWTWCYPFFLAEKRTDTISEHNWICVLPCLEPRTSFTKNLGKQSCSGNLSHHVMDLGNSYISILQRVIWSLCGEWKRDMYEWILTWTAEVEVAVAPPGRKTFFCTFGAINLLKNNIRPPELNLFF